MNTVNIECKYIFLDIERFASGRTIEAQTGILRKLNGIVLASLKECQIPADKLILLPTGDGICIVLLDISQPYDIQLKIALRILRKIHRHNASQHDDLSKFTVRIGLNENNDTLVTDINNRRNVAGAGINYAQRIMNLGNGGNILVGGGVHSKLSQRQKYYKSFRKYVAPVKHGENLIVYQFVDETTPYLNSTNPTVFKIYRSETTPMKPSLRLACHLLVLNLLEKQIADINKSVSDISPIRVASSYCSRMYYTIYKNTTEAIKGPVIDPAHCLDQQTYEINLRKATEYYGDLYFEILKDLDAYFEGGLYGKREFGYLFEDKSQYLKISKIGRSVLKKEYKDLVKYFEGK